MANAQLDDDFKEEMAAIEQWFTVLSECERTTVLYSLIQNISELQVRFFLTLLQQKVKSNPLFNSIIKRPISDSIYSSTSTKHCSNTSSENSSMIHSSSTDTYYDDEDYQKNSFVDASKSSSSQFNCPLNMNEFNMAMNSLSNADFLNERTSSLARPTSKSHTSANATNHHQTTPAANNATPATAAAAVATSRKNSYMNTMMNDYSNVNVNVNVTSPNLNVLGNINNMNNMNNMNRYNVNDSVLLNGMSNATPSNPTTAMMNSQFLPITNNLPLLNQNTINSLMNPYNTNNSTTSALPVLSSNSTLGLGGSKDDIYTASTNQTSPRVSPIRPPKPSNANKTEGKEATEPKMETSTTTTATTTKTTVKNRPRNKSLTQILLTNMEVKEGSKNASILTDILNLSKEMNDMVNKNKERAKKEKMARSTTTTTTPTPPTSPKVKKSNGSEDGAESVVGSTANTVTPSREKGKIPDQIDLEMLEDIPVFLRSLRLHKYAPAFEGLNWKQMIRLDNDELLSRGVSALGARNKMLKVFDLIRAEAIKQNVSLEC